MFFGISKTIVVSGIILIFSITLMLIIPPSDICDVQIEAFRDKQSKSIFRPQKGLDQEMAQTRMEKLFAVCRQTNSVGGCFELFASLTKFVHDLANVSLQCQHALAKIDPVKATLFDGIELMTKIAWGAHPPDMAADKYGWLEETEKTLFCLLKDRTIIIFGKEKWQEFYENLLNTLPGSEKMTHQQKWDKSILSTNCNYLL